MTNYEILTLVLITIAILLISGLVYWRDWWVYLQNNKKRKKLEKLLRQIEQIKILRNKYAEKERKLFKEIDELLTKAEKLAKKPEKK